MIKVVAIGEIVWDIFGNEKHLGGAPFNFSYFAGTLGAESKMISRIGKDELGKEILCIIQEKKINPKHIQIDPLHSSGKVLVETEDPKNPKFTIVKDVAYDYMELQENDKNLAKDSDIICFGTLAQRNPKSRNTMQSLLNEAKKALIIYDVNIRQNFYSKEIIEKSLHLTNILKLNLDEMHLLKKLLNLNKPDKDAALNIIEKYCLKLICLTNGEKGCEVFSKEESFLSPAYEVKVKDTVGSGDAFAAGFAIKYLETGNIKKSADFANLIGSYVASKRGAMPEINWQEIEKIKEV